MRGHEKEKEKEKSIVVAGMAAAGCSMRSCCSYSAYYSSHASLDLLTCKDACRLDRTHGLVAIDF